MNRLIEIRTYKLKTGSGAKFHELVANESAPLLAAAGTDVVTFGRSLNDPDGYYLIRAYKSLEHLQTSQESFYASAAWCQGPRAAITDLIDANVSAVLWLAESAVEALRRSKEGEAA